MRRNRKITATTSTIVSISANSTSLTDARMVVVRSVRMATLTAAGSDSVSVGSSVLMRSTTVMMLAPGWRCTLRMTAGVVVHRRGLADILDGISDGRDVLQADRRAVPVRDDHLGVAVAREQLIVGPNLIVLARAVEAAFGLVDVGRRDRGPHVFEVQAVGCERGRIRADANGRLLASGERHQPDAGQLRDFGARRVSARSWTVDSGSVSDVSASVRIGASAGFTLL